MKDTLNTICLSNILLLIFVILLYFSASPENEFWWSDESRHAMDGVFFYDFFRDFPLTNLQAYLEEYIVRFPALSFTWNLPFFAVISAPFYGLLGISVFTAQLVVLAFACTLALTMNLWGKEYFSPIVSITSVVFFFLNEYVLLWMRSVMLEIPALTMMFLTLLASKKFIQNPSYKYALIFGLTGFSMLMTKQMTLFILPVLIIYAWYQKKLSTLWDKHSWPAYLFVISGMAGIAIHALTIGTSGFSSVSHTYSNILSLMLFERLPLITNALSNFLPLPIIILALVGIFLGIQGNNKRKICFLLAWIILAGVFIGFITKSPGNAIRYCIYIAAPIYLLAISVLDYFRIKSVQYFIFCGILASFLAWNVYHALQKKNPFVIGYEEIAKYVYQLPKKRPVLFCCDHDGNYIFSMRAIDKERRTITLRADKLLVTIIISPLRGVTSHAKNSQQVTKILDEYGIGYLVIEEDTYTQVEEFEMLRKIVLGDQFERLKTFPISAGDESYQGKVKGTAKIVNVYRYLNAKPIKNGRISIPLPRYNRTAILQVD